MARKAFDRKAYPASDMPILTMDEALALRYGQTVYHRVNRNADGTPQRWRVSGMVKTWKRDSSRIRIPVKYGMYSNDAITENDLDLLSLVDPSRDN